MVSAQVSNDSTRENNQRQDFFADAKSAVLVQKSAINSVTPTRHDEIIKIATQVLNDSLAAFDANELFKKMLGDDLKNAKVNAKIFADGQFYVEWHIVHGVEKTMINPNNPVESYTYPPGSAEISFYITNTGFTTHDQTRSYSLPMIMPKLQTSFYFKLGTPNAILDNQAIDAYKASIYGFLVSCGINPADVPTFYPSLIPHKISRSN